jgi:hypothetical protein
MGKTEYQNTANATKPTSTAGNQQATVSTKKSKKPKATLPVDESVTIKQTVKPTKKSTPSKTKTLASNYFNASTGFSANIKQEFDTLAAGKVKSHS